MAHADKLKIVSIAESLTAYTSLYTTALYDIRYTVFSYFCDIQLLP